ncbi:MAG: ABC transporter ATP-binding protein [Coriobacteriia bacterium]|nr:ABC transporter ATP-binding protein [Coriobacteriia bacterium]
MNDVAIKATGLTKAYSWNKPALEDIGFTVEGTGITGLVGRNGAGKTTLLKLCAGLLDATAGQLEVWGEDPRDNLSVLSRLVYSYPNLKYGQVLKLRDILHDYATLFPAFDREFAQGLISYFDLNAKQRYKALSQGMASTFNFICALACRTPLTLFDEPTLGMDVTVRRAVYEILLREYNEYPRTFIVSSHLMSELEGILTDVLLIDEGKLVLHDTIDHLRQSSYLLEGDSEALDRFCQGKNVIYRKQGETGAAAVIFEEAGEGCVQEAGARGLKLSAVRPEDLCVYLTRENKEGELECLWQKAS